MPFIYALIAQGVKIISEHSLGTGNFQQIIVSLLPKLQPNRRRSFKNEEYAFFRLIYPHIDSMFIHIVAMG